MCFSLNTDILLAHNCGIRSLHVHTGVHHSHDVEKLLTSDAPDDRKLIPDYYTDSFADILTLYTKAEQSDVNS